MTRLILHLPDGKQSSLDLPPGQPVTLGRSRDNVARIDDGTVSRHHARLLPREDGACLVEDLRSANGTTVNGQTVERFALQDGDRLSFGDIEATYQVADADAARLVAPDTTVGQVFGGRYRLDNALAETDEYENFLAADLASKARRISLKIFDPDVIRRVGGIEHIRREFARARAIPAHPHLVRLLDCGRWRGVSFLAAEWIEGYPLLDLLRRQGAVPRSGALRLAGQAAAVTDHARAHGLPAPDLGPRAMLLACDKPPLAANWEQAFDAPAERWPPFTLKIAPRLFAPEGDAPWPLGALCCELLGYPSISQRPFRPARIALLGERGNAILARGFATAGKAFGTDANFIAELGRVAENAD